MAIPKLSLQSLDTVTHRRRVTESVNEIIGLPGGPAPRHLVHRAFSGDTSTFLTDDGGALYYNGVGGHTLTLNLDVPPDGVVTIRNAGGGALTIAPTGNLHWFGGAGSLPTGNRTLAIGGVATAFKDPATDWHIWGIGLS